MTISSHTKSACDDLRLWLDHARSSCAGSRRSSIAFDPKFCAAADRFIAAIKLESGIDEVGRRALLLDEISGEGSPYYKAVAAAQSSGVAYGDRGSITHTNPKYKQIFSPPLHSTFRAYDEWKAIQFALGDEYSRWTDDQIEAMKVWATECDNIIKMSSRMKCDGCMVLVRASKLLPGFQSGRIKVMWKTFKSIEEFESDAKKTPAPRIGMESIRNTRNAINSLMKWLKRQSKRPKLNPQQQEALNYIKNRGPVKGVLIANHVNVHESTFRTHYLRILRKHGVKNDGHGYYVEE